MTESAFGFIPRGRSWGCEGSPHIRSDGWSGAIIRWIWLMWTAGGRNQASLPNEWQGHGEHEFDVTPGHLGVRSFQSPVDLSFPYTISRHTFGSFTIITMITENLPCTRPWARQFAHIISRQIPATPGREVLFSAAYGSGIQEQCPLGDQTVQSGW